jgi:hypothetical protein
VRCIHSSTYTGAVVHCHCTQGCGCAPVCWLWRWGRVADRRFPCGGANCAPARWLCSYPVRWLCSYPVRWLCSYPVRWLRGGCAWWLALTEHDGVRVAVVGEDLPLHRLTRGRRHPHPHPTHIPVHPAISAVISRYELYHSIVWGKCCPKVRFFAPVNSMGTSTSVPPAGLESWGVRKVH